MKKKKYNCLIAFLGLLLASCVNEFVPDISGDYTSLLVIEGDILSEGTSVFYVGETTSLGAQSMDAASPNRVEYIAVVGEDGYESEPGVQIDYNTFHVETASLDENKRYAVRVITTAHHYQSEFTAPLATPPIDSITYEQKEDFGDVDFRLSSDGGDESGFFYFRWAYEETWEIRMSFYTSIFYDPYRETIYEGTPNYICWKHNNQHDILVASTETYTGHKLVNYKLFTRNPAEEARFTILYRLKVTQRRISKESYKYQQNKILLNQEMGGLFTPQPAEIKSNVRCITDPSLKAIGYINVLKNTSDYTLYIPATEITTLADRACRLHDYGDSHLYYYNAGYRPVGGNRKGQIEIEGWAPARCVDCVVAGGKLEKPQDWGQ